MTMTIAVYKVARLGLIKDGKLGATIQRAERIKAALKWTAGQQKIN